MFIDTCDELCQNAKQAALQARMDAADHDAFIWLLTLVFLGVGVLLVMHGFGHITQYAWHSNEEHKTNLRNAMLCRIAGIVLIAIAMGKLLTFYILG